MQPPVVILSNFDRISFLLGLVTGAILLWVLIRLRPWLRRIFSSATSRQQVSRQERRLVDEIRLGNDTLRLSQGWHIAAPLFSLDEILILPRVLAPPELPMVYEPPPSEDVTDWAIPYMPDWPELPSFYGAPSLTLAEALQGGANLAVIGQPGSGKTVALAHLAIQFIQKSGSPDVPVDLVPVLIHVADLALAPQNLEPEKPPGDPFVALSNAVAIHASSLPKRRLTSFLQLILKQGRALLILDGLDELSTEMLGDATRFLAGLFEKYPNLRAVVAASPNNLGELLSLGFQTLSLACWNQEQRMEFIHRWCDLWNRFAGESGKSEAVVADSFLLIGWLANSSANLTPLELTLKVWAAFAGDSLGQSPIAAIEAYLRRTTAKQSDKNRLALEQLASQMVLAMQPVADVSTVRRWLGGADLITLEDDVMSDEVEATPKEQSPRQKPIRARGALPDLVESGLLVPHAEERISLVHPTLTGFLASRAIVSTPAASQIAGQFEWAGKSTTLQFLAIMDASAAWIGEFIRKGKEDDPLFRNLISASRWLRLAPEGLPWISSVMRELVGCLQKDTQSLALQGSALTALALSGYPGVVVLFRQMLASLFAHQRQFAALGCGFIGDAKSVGETKEMINDRSPGTSRAALLSLVAIGNKDALEAVAYTLLHGDESLRRSAAEALSNHPEEGYPTLEEGCTLQDPAVRRAAVFGLGRIGKLPSKRAWATNILQIMQTQESQWMVKDAVNQMLEAILEGNPRLTRPLPPLTQTAWLISFAEERAMGVAPGKPAYELLYRVLAEGNEDQRIAAIYCLGQYTEESSALPLLRTYYSNVGEIREFAYQALRNLAVSGISLPSAAQYGLR